jgi:hypothetical protein
MTDEPQGGFGCVLPFDTDDSEFCRGFEAGRLWEMLRDHEGDAPLAGQQFHASNAEMILRMLDALGRNDLRADIEDDTWMVLRHA